MIVEVDYITRNGKCLPKRRHNVLFNRIKDVSQKTEHILTPSLDFEKQPSNLIPIRMGSSSIQAFQETINSPHVVGIKSQKSGSTFNTYQLISLAAIKWSGKSTF